MQYNYKLVFLKLILFFYLFINLNCDNSSNQKANYFTNNLTLNNLSKNYNINIFNNKIEFIQNNQQITFTGNYFSVETIKKIPIKTIKISDLTNNKIQFLSFKIYINNKFLGKFKLNELIKINKNISSLKILFIKTGNEKTIKAWDENFNYKFIDINNLESIKQLNIELFFNNTQKYNQVSLFKTGKNKFSKSKFKRHINAHNQNYRYNINTNKKTNIVTESSFIFNSDGSFKIYQLCASKNEKKIKTELFYEGNWIAKKLEKGFLLEMSGYISGYFSENNKKYINSEFYNLKATFIDNKLIFKNLLNNFNIDFPNSSLISINELAQNIIVDMPYSTTKNFTGLKLYPCNKCYLRYKVAMDLLKANNMFNKLNYKIKIFDCYRPFFVQAIMFKKFPISGYVADSIWGSIHNRAGAVDLTITDNAGNELNMGTKFDELSYKSNHNYIYFSDTILKNRRFLKKIMMENNFVPINGEWWHYNHINAREYSKLNDNFPCQN